MFSFFKKKQSLLFNWWTQTSSCWCSRDFEIIGTSHSDTSCLGQNKISRVRKDFTSIRRTFYLSLSLFVLLNTNTKQVVKYDWGHAATGQSMKRSLVVLLDVSADAKYPDAKARILGLKFVSTTSPPSLSALELTGVMPLGTAWPKSSASSNVTSWQSLVGMKRTDHSSAHELCRSILQRVRSSRAQSQIRLDRLGLPSV